MRTAQDLFTRAGIILLDEGVIVDRRTKLSELCLWLNDGIAEIVTHKPSATARTVDVALAEGTLQAIPAGYLAILRPVRNARGPSSDRRPRRTITVVSENTLSLINPAWHDSYSVRFQQQVKHFVFDEVNPKAFYVYPGNDGTGLVEMVLCAEPTYIVAAGEAEAMTSYNVALPLDDTYFNALLDWVLYRTYAKDAQNAGAAQRATQHYQLFANALGINIAAQTGSSPNIKAGVQPATGGIANA